MKINQILWIINGETKNLVPVKIVEKITKETSLGQQIEFVIETVSGKKRNLSEIKDRYFETSDEARIFLLESASKMINEIVERAIVNANRFSGVPVDVQDSEPPDIMDVGEQEMIQLPDGRMARVRVKPSEAQ